MSKAMAVMAEALVRGYLTPKLAMDASLDVRSLVRGVTPTNIKANSVKLAAKIRDAVRGRLAQDADVDDIEEVIEQLAEMAPQVAEVVAEENDGKTDPDANDEGADDMTIASCLAFLTTKLSDEDIEKVKAIVGDDDSATLDENMTEEDKAKAAKAKLAKDAAAKAAKDALPAPKPGVSKAAMDAAIAATRKEVETSTIQRLRAISTAEEEVRPYVGKLAMAQDSAEDVYKLALDTMKVDTKGVHPSALRSILMAQAVPGATTRRTTALAMDAAGMKGYAERFPGVTTLKRR